MEGGQVGRARRLLATLSRSCLDRVADLLEEGDEGGDTQDLSTDQESLNPLGRDLDGADTVEDANDELDVLKGEADVVRSQLLVQVDDVDAWLVPEEVLEILTGGGKYNL